MGKVAFGLSVSLDGFIAGKHDDVSEVFAWMGRAMEQFHEVMGGAMGENGAVIMGHRSFDMIDSDQGWVFPDGTAPDWPVIVLQSQARAPVKKGKTQFYFVTDGIESAIAKAQELAGDRVVEVAAGDVGGQVFAAGLVDEVRMDVVPVVFGSGKRFFGPVHAQHLLEDPDVVVQGNRVLHLRYRVRR